MLTYLHANFPSDFMICSIAIGATITYTDPLGKEFHWSIEMYWDIFPSPSF